MRQLLFDIAATLYVSFSVMLFAFLIIWAIDINNNYSEFSAGRGLVGFFLVVTLVAIVRSYIGDS